jgi:hypothetical protein
MATLAQIKSRVEDFRATHGPKIKAKQDAYFAMIFTPDLPPDDGADVDPDLTKRPTDQPDRWSTFLVGSGFPLTKWPGSVAVDVYEGSLGWGWTVRFEATKNAKRYRRTWNVGPETWRSTGWIREEDPGG